MADSGLKVENLTKGFGRGDEADAVLRGLRLELLPRELVSIIGASGAGKTTLLRTISNLELPDSGNVTFAGRPLARGQVSYVFQKPLLYPHLTVRDNIVFGTKLRGFKQKLDGELFDYLVEVLKLQDFLDRKPDQLSGGQAQRVSIARALIRKAPVVLFDEPLSSVDEELSASIRTEIQQLHQDLGFTGVYITHDQNEALQLGQRVAVLHGGRIEQLATPTEIMQEPASLAVLRLTGHPALTEIETSRGTIVARATAFSRELFANRSGVLLTSSRLTLGGELCTGELTEDTVWTARGGETVAIPAGSAVSWLQKPGSAEKPGQRLTIGASERDLHFFPKN